MEYFVVIECSLTRRHRVENFEATLELAKQRIIDTMLELWKTPLQILYEKFGPTMSNCYTDTVFDWQNARLQRVPEKYSEGREYEWPVVKARIYSFPVGPEDLPKEIEVDMYDLWRSAKQQFPADPTKFHFFKPLSSRT